MSSTTCIKPFFRKDSDVALPCGSCPSCRLRRASDWSFRLMEEAKVHSTSFFITLTYDTTHVPITENGFMSLRKRDLQLFFKRLRKIDKAAGNKFKYYAVGEYGGRSRRPHYHIIAFSTTISKVELAWQLGTVHYGSVSGASIGYTLKYITKPRTVPKHMNDDRVPEFSLMSKDWGSHTYRKQLSDGISRTLQEEYTVISPVVQKSQCRVIIGKEYTPLKKADILRVSSKEEEDFWMRLLYGWGK